MHTPWDIFVAIIDLRRTAIFVSNGKQGTPLRQVFKTARLTLDDAAAKARERTTDRQREMAERMQKMVKARKARFEEMDKSGGERRAGRKKKGICCGCSRCGCCCVEGPGWVRVEKQNSRCNFVR